jgi:glutamyl-tRNA reductase
VQQVQTLKGFEESVVLSTCNRVEIYSTHTHKQAEAAHDELITYLVNRFELAPEQAEALVTYKLDAAEAARHLFRVVSGLDSMVLGETEIFGQVKAAYQLALNTGTTGRTLNKLFQQAFSVGKKVRNETNIQRGSTSVGSVAVDLAEKVHDLKQCRVMLVGAGEMSRTCAQSLLSRGAKSIIVSNRSHERAVELATEMGGKALKFDEWEGSMHEVDVIISSTSAPHFVIRPDQIQQVMKKRRWEPLLIIDIAVPRDVDPLVNGIEGVYLYDIDALQAIADEGRREREKQLFVCEQIIEEQLNKYGFA